MENNMTTLDMVNAAISGDKEAFQAAFSRSRSRRNKQHLIVQEFLR